MAAAILAVGFVMIAGTFPVAIFLTAVSVEQTIAPIVADEAFAKIQLYGINFTGTSYSLPSFNAALNKSEDFNNINKVKTATENINGKEYLYPSDNNLTDRMYNWSAICRRLADSMIHWCRLRCLSAGRRGRSLQYPDPLGGTASWPTPVRITAGPVGATGNQIQVGGQNFVTDGCVIVADASGNIYRVIDHNSFGIVTLDRTWSDVTSDIWVIPPPKTGGKSPMYRSVSEDH